jgi:tRNA-dihydrouridine synthase B
MISANALVANSKKTLKMLEKSEDENPYLIQIAGSNKDIIKKAVLEINKLDNIAGIDLNCGCPAPKVSNHGSGSSLLKDLDNLKIILETIKKYSNKKYTSVKVRIGYDSKIPFDIAKACEEAGVDFIAVHGRTKAGKYKAPVDYDAIKLMKESINIPLIANGDIKNYEKSEQVLKHTNADGIMIGRGAIGSPWVFDSIKNQGIEFNAKEKKKYIINHLDKMIQFYDKFGVILFRKHLHKYSKGLKEASEFRDKVNIMENADDVYKTIDTFFI